MNNRIGRVTTWYTVLLLTACSMQPQPGGTYVWIDVPVDATTLTELQPVQIEGHASSPGGINRVEVSVNGEPLTPLDNLSSDGNLADFHTIWAPTEPGEYTIQVVAYGVNNMASKPDLTHVRFGKLVEPETSVGPPSATPTPDATPTPTATNTPTNPPDTPTPTHTSLPAPVVEFWADPTTIQAGGCTELSWHVENIHKVVFGGIDQPFDGSDTECMCENHIFPLTVTHLDGKEERLTVEITVNGECATPVPADTTPPSAPVLSVPSDLLSLSCRASQNLVWLPVSDPSGIAEYQVQVQRSADNASWVDLPGSPITGIADKSTNVTVECGWYYRWRVRAVDGKGNIGAWSGWSRYSILLG